MNLAQIEPHTAISSAPFTISVPGFYYLTTRLTVTAGNAITIVTNGVTLDLSGFAISSTAPSATGYGILLNHGLHSLTIVNGSIQVGVTSTSGIYARTVLNCYGYCPGSGAGLSANNAQNCSGHSESGDGLNISRTAIGCHGYSTSGTGLSALIASSCRSETSSDTAQSMTYKYNMP